MARSPRPPDPRTGYLEAVQRVLTRKLFRRRPDDTDDIVQAESVRLWERIDAIMIAYPDPATYAAVRAHHAAIQWDRSQQAQRGEGARLVTHDDGTVATRRTVVSGDRVVGDDGVELFSLLPSVVTDVDEFVVESLHGAGLLERALVGMSATDRAVLYLVDGFQVPVSDVAAMHGVTRETMSRRVSTLRTRARLNVADMMSEREVIVT